MPQIKTVYICNHTHTDIGFTDYQDVCFRQHAEFYGQALDLIEATSDYPEALLPGAARPLAESISSALVHAAPPSGHMYTQRGPQRREAESLFAIDTAGALLSGVHVGDAVVRLYFLNPSDDETHVSVGPGALTPNAAWRCSLAGEHGEALALTDGFARMALPTRTWHVMEVHL